jgi:hypothetical protein
MPLPPGLSPVEAGRFGLWLLGQRKQRAAQKRRASKGWRVYSRYELGRFCAMAAPWRVAEYQSGETLVARLCGVAEQSVVSWMYTPDRLPAKHARTLAAYIRQFDGPALARELEAYADARDARIGARKPRVRRTGRDGDGS